MNEHVVIVGAGLGGLECGYILAKNGMRVTVLEHDAQVGGCLQSFRRGIVLFDSGFHYVGGLREGESLHGLFKYFDLLDLQWQQLDEECFDEVVFGDNSYKFASGHERFVETLAEAFPHEKKNLAVYTNFLRSVGEHIADTFLPREVTDFYADSLFARSAYQFLNDTIQDTLLRRVLSGTSLKLELNRDMLPLYVFAQINNSFIQSAWRLRGGGQQLVDKLADSIRTMGGQVLTKKTVTAINEQDGVVTGVMVNGEEYVPADYVICDVHPVAALELLGESKCVRKVFRHRIESLKNSYGMFTVNIRLKANNSLPYFNRNIFVHKPDADLWQVNTSTPESVMVSFYCDQPAVDLLTPMRWEQVEHWSDTEAGHRGKDYVEFKQQKTEQCLDMVSSILPELRVSIDRVFTSTPLTYRHYTLTHQGSAYGIQKDWRSPMTTVLAPRMSVRNMLLTGQNLNLHGVLGVSMTSVLTCAQILGMDTLYQQLDVKHWK